MKKYLLPAALCLALCGSCSKSASNGADARMDEFIDSLMSEMTLEEKLGQLNLLTYNGDIATGLRHDSDMAAEVARGRVGGVLNARGELIGLAFDGNIESLSSDLKFNPALQRCINVDIRYVLFIIDKFGGSIYAVEEMDVRL